jgi:hypothetical protein
MGIPIRFKFFGVEVDTEVSVDTANKIACGIAGVAAGTAVIVAGAAIGNGDVVKVGCGIAVGSALGAGAVIGLGDKQPERLTG